MKIDFNFDPDTKVTLTAGGRTETVDLWSRAHRLFEGQAGRVNVFDVAMTVPSSGTAVLRADGKTTLNLLNEAGPADVSVSLQNNRKGLVRTPASEQKFGHPSGEHYWLPVGANGRFVCEPGQLHRKVYISKSEKALTTTQIAAHAGVPATAVTAAWLATRTQYGGTPETAVHASVGRLIKSALVAARTPRSDHYLLERGYDYSDMGWSGVCGEDDIHPALIGAWGNGSAPVVNLSSAFLMLPRSVVQDVATDKEKYGMKYAYSLAYDHVEVGLELQMGSSSTLTTYRECQILNAWWAVPRTIDTQKDGSKTWAPQSANYISGIFAGENDRVLVDSSLIDHSGWGEGYDFNLSPDQPQPPTMYSHNIYFSTNTFDVMIRNNMLSRSSSCGVQLRAGVQLEGNLFIDNNLNVAANSWNGFGQFNNVLDNAVFSAGFRRVVQHGGGYHWGYDVNGPGSAMVGNIVAHQADPDDAADVAAKTQTWNNFGISTSEKLADDTRSWKFGKLNRNVEHLNPSVLDTTTAHRMGGMLAGKSSLTLQQFVDHMAASDSIGDKVRKGLRWAQSRFGNMPAAPRSTPVSAVFTPDTRMDGFRWDNRYNWSTRDLPGTHAADSAALAGNFVRFGTVNSSIAALKSSGGVLDVTSGKLQIGTLSDAANIALRMSGQAWIGNAAHDLAVTATGGRLALTGKASKLDLHAGGETQVLLGPDATVPAGKSLIVSGTKVRVGWDGTGTASLKIAGTLEFRRGVEVIVDQNDMQAFSKIYLHIGKQVTGSISGFRGRVAGVAPLTERGQGQRIWFDDVSGIPVVGDVFEVTSGRGDKGVVTPKTCTVKTVVGQGIPSLSRFRSGAVGTGLIDPAVTVTVTLSGTVKVPAGLDEGTYDLGGGAGTGVMYVNSGASLPKGVTLSAGKLILTVPKQEAEIVPSPAVLSVPTITGNTTLGSTLTRKAGTASGGAAQTVQWLRNGTVIGGQAGDTLATTAFAVGDTITTRDVWTNGGGSVSGTSTGLVLTAVPDPVLPLPQAFGVTLRKNADGYYLNETPATFRALYTKGTIFVSVTGNDAAAGTQATPLATLDAAIAKVANYGTISLAPGEYAMPTAAVNKPLRLARTGTTGEVYIGDWVQASGLTWGAMSSSGGTYFRTARDPAGVGYAGGLIFDQDLARSLGWTAYDTVGISISETSYNNAVQKGFPLHFQSTSNHFFSVWLPGSVSPASYLNAGQAHILRSNGDIRPSMVVSGGGEVMIDDYVTLASRGVNGTVRVLGGGRFYLSSKGRIYGTGGDSIRIDDAAQTFLAGYVSGASNNTINYTNPAALCVESGVYVPWGGANCSTAHGANVLRINGQYLGGGSNCRIIGDLTSRVVMLGCTVRNMTGYTAAALIRMGSAGTTGSGQVHHSACTFGGLYDTAVSDAPGIDNNSVNPVITWGLKDPWPFT